MPPTPPPTDDPFGRDLSYLFKFLETLEAHAIALGGTRGAALTALLEGQMARWTAISALLRGETGGTEADVPPGDGELDVSEAHETTDVTLGGAAAVEPTTTEGTVVDMPASGRATAPRPPSTRGADAPTGPRVTLTVGSLLDGPRKR